MTRILTTSIPLPLSTLPYPTLLPIQALLYPLQWVHVFVPVVPAHLFDLVEAPVPYMLGVGTCQRRPFLPSSCSCSCSCSSSSSSTCSCSCSCFTIIPLCSSFHISLFLYCYNPHSNHLLSGSYHVSYTYTYTYTFAIAGSFSLAVLHSQGVL